MTYVAEHHHNIDEQFVIDAARPFANYRGVMGLTGDDIGA